MAKPTAIEGSVFDPVVSNDLASINSLIGFEGNSSTGVATGPEGQTAALHRIGSAVTTEPGVLGGAAIPVNTVAPTISGTATVGNTLTGNPGTWTGTPTPVLTYQWLGDDVALSGETALTLVLTSSHTGMVIKFQVTGTNAHGSDVGTSAGTSAVT